ncbi:MAG TPA: hypothetical protein VLC09_14915, partial [Polyangiaceae bacterium]|nr:hypothetical protein [Polyangiaceae bacterium]
MTSRTVRSLRFTALGCMLWLPSVALAQTAAPAPSTPPSAPPTPTPAPPAATPAPAAPSGDSAPSSEPSASGEAPQEGQPTEPSGSQPSTA